MRSTGTDCWRTPESTMATPPAPPQKPACPRCGAAGGGVGGGPSPSQPSSQPDEAGQETAGGVVAACTSCGFIMDDTPLDGRPPPRRGEQEGGRGGGGGNGGVSGGGEGFFVSAHAGALTAAGACNGRAGQPARVWEEGLGGRGAPVARLATLKKTTPASLAPPRRMRPTPRQPLVPSHHIPSLSPTPSRRRRPHRRP